MIGEEKNKESRMEIAESRRRKACYSFKQAFRPEPNSWPKNSKERNEMCRTTNRFLYRSII